MTPKATKKKDKDTRYTLLPTHCQISLKVFNSQHWLYAGRRYGLTSQIAQLQNPDLVKRFYTFKFQAPSNLKKDHWIGYF
jgi:hypothetical protein